MDERFGKDYKLCSKKIMAAIFEKGKFEKTYPFILRYLATDLPTSKCFQVVISVPKRKFKRAVDRNRIKRVIREAVRKNKYILEQAYDEGETQMALFIIYSSNKEEPYQKVFNKIESLFQRLVKNG